jgi:hypothetical protein
VTYGLIGTALTLAAFSVTVRAIAPSWW